MQRAVTRVKPVWPAIALTGAAVGVGALAVVHPVLGVGAAAGACVLTLCAIYAHRLPGLFMWTLGAVLVVYALLEKGGAYLGVSGVFVGEVVLGCGLLAALFCGVPSHVFRSPLVWGLAAFGGWGALQLLPYIGGYGINAFRDAVVWGYAAFAVLVAGYVSRPGEVARVVARYASRFAWWYPWWVPVSWTIVRHAPTVIPDVPGTTIPLLNFKPGDVAFHLAGVAAFVLLGLGERPAGSRRPPYALGGWMWWAAWAVGFALVAAWSRASLLALVAAGAIVLTFRPTPRMWRPALWVVVLGVAAVAFDVKIQVRDERYLSPIEMLANLRSIAGREDSGSRDDTREWRLNWWRDIVNYTVHGPYFWTGKGFGRNIAIEDGYADPSEKYPLRSPHNSHLTLLARTGVPGIVLWAVIQGSFAWALAAGYQQRQREDPVVARLYIWTLAYWAAFMVNAAFDVTLEGPHGGIWFWSVFGFGIALLQTPRTAARGARAVALTAAAAGRPAHLPVPTYAHRSFR